MRRFPLCLLPVLLAGCDSDDKRADEKDDSPQIESIKQAVVERAEAERKEGKLDRDSLAPALKFLPPGSTLKDVRIPRYDDEYRRAALIRTEVLEVHSEHHVSSDNIELRYFAGNDKEAVRVHMGAAEYFLDTGLLHARELLTVRGDNVKASGTGGVFHLESRQGFVHGPVTTAFVIPPKEKQGNDDEPPAAEASDAPLPVPAELAPEFHEPEPLTRAQLVEIDALLKSRSRSVLADRAPTREFMVRSQQLSQAAEIGLRSFSSRVGQGSLLSLVPDGQPLLPNQHRQPQNEGELLVTSKGGMFIDAERGHVAYLRDIEVAEVRFTLTCSDRLLVFGEVKPGASLDKISSPQEFAKPKTIVATGGVRIAFNSPDRKDEDPPVIATAETAVIDVMTRDVVLQGGSPSISQGANSIRADEPDLYLHFYPNGNIFAGKGRWTTVGELTALKIGDGGSLALGGQAEKDEDEAGPETKDAEPQLLSVTCTGGMYFDAKEGQVVYLKDVEVREDRFRMACSKELKAFLRRKPAAVADESSGLEAFSDVDFLVASGDVTLVRSDGDEQRAPAIATAAHVIVNARSRDVILTGGTPTVRQGENALVAGAEDLYLRFYENGSLYAAPGKWTTTGDLANLRLKPGEAKKPARIITGTCHGGISFDSLKGEIVYREDIDVVEPRFRMNCKGEMTIHLEERKGEGDERLRGPEAFSELRGIIATGGVRVTRQDPKGQKPPITASAYRGRYDARTGDFVLEEGYPEVRQGKTFLKAEEKGLWIKFFANGDVITSKGKWDGNLQTKSFEDVRP